MGTDIHPHAERRVWIPSRTEEGRYGPWTRVTDVRICDDRNYDCFAILADVRNGVGFAGVITGAGWRPISEPRGLPRDLAEGYDEWSFGDHSLSWLSLRELLEYDYTQESRKEGVISLDEFARLERNRTYDKYASPQSWAGGVSGPGVKIILPEEARTIIAGWDRETADAALRGRGGIAVASDVFVRETWPKTYLDVMGGFLLSLIPLVRYGLDDVRIVFGFDS